MGWFINQESTLHKVSWAPRPQLGPLGVLPVVLRTPYSFLLVLNILEPVGHTLPSMGTYFKMQFQVSIITLILYSHVHLFKIISAATIFQGAFCQLKLETFESGLKTHEVDHVRT